MCALVMGKMVLKNCVRRHFTTCWQRCHCRMYAAGLPMVKHEMRQPPVLLLSGGDAVDEDVRHARCSQHVDWWKLLVDAVARRRL